MGTWLGWGRAFDRYLQQNLTVRQIYHCHWLLALLVISQIINSNFIHMTHTGVLRGGLWSGVFLGLHIALGLIAALVFIIMLQQMLSQQGLRVFFPYLYGDMQALQRNWQQIRNKQLPEMLPGGIANIVQGLGMGAMLLVLTSGLLWLVCWQWAPDVANELRHLHKSLTGLVELYLYGHGGMAILHFIATRQQYLSR